MLKYKKVLLVSEIIYCKKGRVLLYKSLNWKIKLRLVSEKGCVFFSFVIVILVVGCFCLVWVFRCLDFDF